MSVTSEEKSEEYWERVEDIGEVVLGQATTVKFQRGVTKRNGREVISFRVWVKGNRYTGPTKQGFNLEPKVAEEFYAMLGKALGKSG
ncbi:MAG: hypothetical protein HY247_05465 [archaeon]|nr:MAG: hypothetical protein HY247_05465 [archaeon]